MLPAANDCELNEIIVNVAANRIVFIFFLRLTYSACTRYRERHAAMKVGDVVRKVTQRNDG